MSALHDNEKCSHCEKPLTAFDIIMNQMLNEDVCTHCYVEVEVVDHA